MKAIIYRDYGAPDVLRLEEIEKPVPGPNEVLARVHCAALNPMDWRLMRGKPYALRLITGLRGIKRPGADFAGRIETVGSNISRFKPGDEVFGVAKGSLAEFVTAGESAITHKPDNISFTSAAAVPIAGLTALQGLRDKGRIHAGQAVLINGASGGVGTFAVQIGKADGAIVTGVCSARNRELVLSLGATHVVDYARDDFTRRESHYDVILDCVGNHSPFDHRRVMTSAGRCVFVGGKKIGAIVGTALKAQLLSRLASRQFVVFVAAVKQTDLAALAQLLAQGDLRPVIDRTFALAETAAGMDYLEAGHARGKVIIKIAEEA